MPKETFHNLPEEKRDKFLAVAITEFANKPYEVASISNIVREAGIAKGSFYQYFDDKKDLYAFLVERSAEEKLKLIKDLPAPNPSSELFDSFESMFRSAVHFEIRQPELARIAYRAFVEEVPFPNMVAELRRRGTTQFFKQLLTQGVIHGDIASETDVDLAAFILETVYYQVGPYLIKRLGLDLSEDDPSAGFENDSINAIVTNLMDIIKGGIQGNTS